MTTKAEFQQCFSNFKAAESKLNEALEDNFQDNLVLIQAKQTLDITSKILRQISVEMRFAQ